MNKLILFYTPIFQNCDPEFIWCVLAFVTAILNIARELHYPIQAEMLQNNGCSRCSFVKLEISFKTGLFCNFRPHTPTLFHKSKNSETEYYPHLFHPQGYSYLASCLLFLALDSTQPRAALLD